MQLDGVRVAEPLLQGEGAPSREGHGVADRRRHQQRVVALGRPATGEDVPHPGDQRGERRHGLGEDRVSRRLVLAAPQQHRVATVERVELAEACPQAIERIDDPGPRRRIGRWVGGEVGPGAGREERPLVREVAIHGQPADAGSLRDRGDRGQGPDLRVAGDRRLDDPPPGVILPLGAALHLVPASHVPPVPHARTGSMIQDVPRCSDACPE